MTEQGSHFEEDEYDNLAPEANPYLPAIIPPYSPKELSRLNVFEHISDIIHSERVLLGRGTKPRIWGKVGPDGTMQEPWLQLDGRFLYTWSRVLDSMYSTEFSGKPHMESAAQNIVNEHRENYEGVGKVMTQGEIENLMERE